MKEKMQSPHTHDRLRDKEGMPNFETTSSGGNVYNVQLLISFAEQLEVEEAPLKELQSAISQGRYYWEDRHGDKLGPHQILMDWKSAQKNKDWADHVAMIQHADLSTPIWLGPDGTVINGMHRLTKAFLDHARTIKVKKFLRLPDEAIV